MPSTILRIAVPTPLRRLFDYLPPVQGGAAIVPGCRVRVPFGRSHAVGVVAELGTRSHLPLDELKRVECVLDAEPLWSATLHRLLLWAADYYHHPPGEVFQAALPTLLRQGKRAAVRVHQRWSLTPAGGAFDLNRLRRAPRQQQLLTLLKAHPTGLYEEELRAQLPAWRVPLQRLVEQDLVVGVEEGYLPPGDGGNGSVPLLLNAQQKVAVATIREGLGQFATCLLDGVTGSGKTEVYLHLIAECIERGEQVLVLVPEIGLTPQLLERFRRRFRQPIAVLHSALTEKERLSGWLAAACGEASIVIGTRSAVFTPMQCSGLIIVDEEHDSSFKQQDGFRYSARDVAIMRAYLEGVPVVLGSATPSLESLHNARQGRAHHLRLSKRAGNACHPQIGLIDLRHQPVNNGLSLALQQAIRRHLDAGDQVLLFLNRRGYAPVLLCLACAWSSQCRRCDAHMTVHAERGRLLCHHCGAECPIPTHCPHCGDGDLYSVGRGTERFEEALSEQFPGEPVVRIDRDTTRHKGALEALLEDIHSGQGRILLGTQMLAKGHHFPNVTLVAILDADQGLFSTDFRASERMAQLIVQVAGRAGRSVRTGEVLIQTHTPDHPLLQHLIYRGYDDFALAALTERAEAVLPPFAWLALLRAEAVTPGASFTFLNAAHALLAPTDGVQVFAPVAAPMERRAGHHRAQLLLHASQRTQLHRLLALWLPRIEQLKEGRKVRWSLDVDPQDMY